MAYAAWGRCVPDRERVDEPYPTTAAQRAKRLHLLDAAEIAALYDRPQFTDEERAYYFTLTPSEVAHMQTFTEGAVQVVFVLQLGYFKAKQRFFSLELAEVRADLIFILEHARLAVAPDDLRTLNPRTIQQQRQLILEHVRYRHTHAAERAQAYQVVLQAARISPKPQYLLRILLQHCAAERVILPGYTTVQETINRKSPCHSLPRRLSVSNATAPIRIMPVTMPCQ